MDAKAAATFRAHMRAVRKEDEGDEKRFLERIMREEAKGAVPRWNEAVVQSY